MRSKSAEEDQSTSDLELIQGCCSNDSLSQELLYRKYYGYAMGICLRYTRNEQDAMELVNDSFLKIFLNISKFNKEKTLRPWIKRIIINTIIDNFRGKRNSIQTESPSGVEKVYFHEDILDNLSANDMIHTINRLPEIYRLVFHLHEMEGYPHKEIIKLFPDEIPVQR